MARRKSATVVSVEPATVQEVRTWLQEQDSLPEGVNAAGRGRLSNKAKEHFTATTGRPIGDPAEAPAAE